MGTLKTGDGRVEWKWGRCFSLALVAVTGRGLTQLSYLSVGKGKQNHVSICG